ncbi:MAG TPA: type II toxin-antitoxin system RelE/ParE family toxin [Thioploca sp.]|nr:MAG: type II toxin-antitoxin system RelE/ParE family toxin [Gammaproteobacteria bacterium]HDN25948.1 type II toxin-antitoxin system RelE/ParE family toxin [Thioploca sp.]
MAYTIQYKPVASRQIAKLSKNIQARLKPKIKVLANNPRPHGAIKLQGYENRYRIRVGDYRIIYEIWDRVLVIVIAEVGHRSDVYGS